jgi:hypothetical protein
VCSLRRDQVVRHRLLRCLLDAGDGLRARELLEVMSYGAPAASSSAAATSNSSSGKASKSKKSKDATPSAPASAAVAPVAAAQTGALKDARSCCCYNRAFIEHISIMLEEPDASEELRDERLGEGKSVAEYSAIIGFLYMIRFTAFLNSVVTDNFR